ncbi:MAG: DUF6644 family protein [Pseudomonadales bacterium]|nr:DUF6644 family protein [Pseudomonadales bacterium]
MFGFLIGESLIAGIGNYLNAGLTRELANELLRSAAFVPPLLQTIHLLSIAAIMGSIVLIDLRALGLAVPSQRLTEMMRRLFPWTWSALLVLLLSGLPFVLARPLRYFNNPVFLIKFALLIPAVLLALLVYRLETARSGFWEYGQQRMILFRTVAVLSLILWLGVALAGRWIAYSDYLFWPE